jgi:GNAT superfamily N-acetyltransferase
MHVDASGRGRGIGARLVAGCVAWARELGAARLHVSAYAANEGAVRFYQANGFAPFTLELSLDL